VVLHVASGREHPADAGEGERVLHACHLGATPYAEGLRIQEALVRARAAGETGDWLLFPDHPPVLTLGRGGGAGNVIAAPEWLRARGIEVHDVTRGGDVTWHGPGQLVGYPVFDLNPLGRDLHRFLRGLEQALIETLGEWGVASHTVPGRTGVWSGGAKVASIGIAVRRWVSYHGFALNVAPDLGMFDLIHPCGLKGIRMTSMAELGVAGAPDLPRVREFVAQALARRFDFARMEWIEQGAVRRVLAAGAAA
jgi:lipoate-protein ligase B